MDNSKIFSYFDGFDTIHADPSEIDYRLAKASESEDMDTLDKWLSIPDKIPRDSQGNLIEDKIDDKQMILFADACHRLDPIIRNAFEIKPFDRKTGEGMLQEDVLGLYLSFIEWRLGVKKNTDELPTAATPTDSAATSSEISREPPSPPPTHAAGAAKPPGPNQQPMGMPRRPSASMGSTSTPVGVSRS